MAQRKPLEIERELLEAFEHAMRVTELVVEAVPDEHWHAPPPQKGRTIAAIVAHIYGLRRTFTKMAGVKVSPTLRSTTATKEEALDRLAENRAALVQLFATAIEERRGRIPGMPRRTAMMMAYLMQHDAHHRGQVTRQLSELGHRLTAEETMKLWGWRKLDG